MKLMKWKFPALLKVALFAGLIAFSSSCGDDDDDKPDCNALFDEITDKFDDYENAMDEFDCDELEDVTSDILDLLNKGKNCEQFIEAVQDEGYDTVEEFIEEAEAEFESVLSDC